MKTKRDVTEWSVERIVKAVRSLELDLDAEYQRDLIWSKERKIKLIDSILKNIDVPKIYFAHFPKEKRYECIDGKQRISSLVDFYTDNLVLDGDKWTYSNLTNEEKDIFLNYTLTVSTITNPSFEDIVELFERLNIGMPLNGGEMMHAMRGDMRNFIFDHAKKPGSFVGEVGIKAYRFSKETTLAQIVINSIQFRDDKFNRSRYEDIRNFLKRPESVTFDAPTKKKVVNIKKNLQEIESVFGDKIALLSRKSVIISAYFFCETALAKQSKSFLKKFPEFYIKLLDEMKVQSEMVKDYKVPKKKILLEKFQKNLQQASAENYAIKARNDFLAEAYRHYLKTGEIIGDQS